jgi:hypothetical protein
MLATEVTENTERNDCFVILIWITANVQGAAFAAINPSYRDEFAAKACAEQSRRADTAKL